MTGEDLEPPHVRLRRCGAGSGDAVLVTRGARIGHEHGAVEAADGHPRGHDSDGGCGERCGECHEDPGVDGDQDCRGRDGNGPHTWFRGPSDFYSRRELNGMTMGAYLAKGGVRHEMMLPLPSDGEDDRRIRS